MFYFRIKSNWTGEKEDGSLVPMKTEDLVMATCYADAEAIATELLNGKDQFGSVTYEIVKTKITEMLYNSTFCHDNQLTCGLVEYYFEENEDDSEVGLYAVNVMYFELNEKTGKFKTTKETVYAPATSAQDAIDFVKQYLKDVESRDWLIRDVKFDKAQSVLVTPDEHKSNVNKFGKYE